MAVSVAALDYTNDNIFLLKAGRTLSGDALLVVLAALSTEQLSFSGP